MHEIFKITTMKQFLLTLIILVTITSCQQQKIGFVDNSKIDE